MYAKQLGAQMYIQGEKHMKQLDIMLANLIRNGRVTVDIPGIEHIEAAFRQESRRMLEAVEAVVFSEEMADGEKIARLKELLGA